MNHLDIPINFNYPVLTKKQHDRLIDICRNNINAFLKDPTEGRESYIEILGEIIDIDKLVNKDEQIESFIDYCLEEMDVHKQQEWDDISKEVLFSIVNDGVNGLDMKNDSDNNIPLDKQCRYILCIGSRKGECCGKRSTDKSSFCQRHEKKMLPYIGIPHGEDNS